MWGRRATFCCDLSEAEDHRLPRCIHTHYQNALPHHRHPYLCIMHVTLFRVAMWPPHTAHRTVNRMFGNPPPTAPPPPLPLMQQPNRSLALYSRYSRERWDRWRCEGSRRWHTAQRSAAAVPTLV